jgi:hypothetical protein
MARFVLISDLLGSSFWNAHAKRSAQRARVVPFDCDRVTLSTGSMKWGNAAASSTQFRSACCAQKSDTGLSIAARDNYRSVGDAACRTDVFRPKVR